MPGFCSSDNACLLYMPAIRYYEWQLISSTSHVAVRRDNVHCVINKIGMCSTGGLHSDNPQRCCLFALLLDVAAVILVATRGGAQAPAHMYVYIKHSCPYIRCVAGSGSKPLLLRLCHSLEVAREDLLM